MAAFAGLAGQASAGSFSFEGDAAIVSDYRWRGVSLSDEDPSLQLEATASHERGVWLWGAVNSVSSDYGGAEINLGLGITRELAGVEWTLDALRYLYPGEDDIDYTELDLTAAKTFGALSVSGGVEYAPDQSNYDGDDEYFWLGAEYAAAHDVTLHAQVGRDHGVMASVPDAMDYAIGAGKAFGAMSADLTYIESDGADSAVVLKLAYAFSGD